MRDILKILIYLMTLIFLSESFAFSDEDKIISPFKKNRKNKMSGEVRFGLESCSISDFDVKGVLVSAQKKWVILSSPSEEIFLLSVGDKVGRENFLIKEIAIDKISLEINDQDKKNLIGDSKVDQRLIKIDESKYVYILTLKT